MLHRRHVKLMDAFASKSKLYLYNAGITENYCVH